MANLINLIREAENFCSICGTNTDAIIRAEKDLELCFANDYKKYVEAFGVASFEGRELTGICTSDRLSVVSATKRARKFYPGFPQHLYVIEEMQFDRVISVQDSAGNIFSYGPNEKITKIAGSLQEYLFPDSVIEMNQKDDSISS